MSWILGNPDDGTWNDLNCTWDNAIVCEDPRLSRFACAPAARSSILGRFACRSWRGGHFWGSPYIF
jgi:hypothetical protein